MRIIANFKEFTLEEKAELMTQLYGEWTTAPPTVGGWFWVTTSGGKLYIEFVECFDGKRCYVNNKPADESIYTHWLGPIPQPVPPT